MSDLALDIVVAAAFTLFVVAATAIMDMMRTRQLRRYTKRDPRTGRFTK